MANYVVKEGKYFCDLSRPIARRSLIERVEELDVAAFKLLYSLYFSDLYKDEFHKYERNAMREVVLNLLDCVLDKLNTVDRHRAVAFLEDVLPLLHNPELFRLDSAIDKIAKALRYEHDAQIRSSINKIFLVIKESYKKAQAESEPE